MKQISLFLTPRSASYMLERNGDVIINPIEATVDMSRNAIWYLDIKFFKSDLLGMDITNECVFRTDLNYIQNQLFRCLYWEIDRLTDTIHCYASHVFFDSQKEVITYDKRAVTKTWAKAIEEVNKMVTQSGAVCPYRVYGQSKDDSVTETENAYWIKYNLIQTLWGSEDNTMVNRWNACELNHYTSMLDNYNCYFGDGSYYPDNLKPQTIRLTVERRVLEYLRKESMEKVVTGIVPQAYNGRKLPNSEIVKSSKWNEYQIHRIDFKSYDKIKFKDDVSGSEVDGKVYNTLAQLQNALREAARTDLKRLDKPEVKYTLKLADISRYDDVNVTELKLIKLNDLIQIHDAKNEKNLIQLWIEKMKYDLINEQVTEIEYLLKE